jgi:hypothetical protein
MRLSHIPAVASLLCAFAFGSAGAQPITETYNFDLGGFVDVLGSSTPPVSNITGSVTLTFDPTLTYDNDTSDITVNSFTGLNQYGTSGPYAYTLQSQIGFTYANGYLEIGGIESDSDLVVVGSTDIVISLNVTNPGDPAFVPCSTPGYTCGQYTGSDLVDASGYTLADYNTGWFYGVPQSNVGVPEPGTGLMLGTGLMGLAAVRRRRT